MKIIMEKIIKNIKDHVGLSIAAVILFIVIFTGSGYAVYRIYITTKSAESILADRTDTTNELNGVKPEKNSSENDKDKSSIKESKPKSNADNTDRKENSKKSSDPENSSSKSNDKTETKADTAANTSSGSKNEASNSSSSSSSSSNSSSSSSGSSSSGSGKSGGSSSSSGSSSGKEQKTTEAQKPSGTTECQHNWVWATKTVHHDAVTHVEDHWEPAWDEPIYRQGTRCSACGTVYNSYEDFRAQDSCGGAYSHTDVLDHYEHHDAELLWSETITDKEAWDEEVNDYQYCSKCGARK